jgi:hypothetical protein
MFHKECRMHAHQDADIVSNQRFISVCHSDVSDELDKVPVVVRFRGGNTHLGSEWGKSMRSE